MTPSNWTEAELLRLIADGIPEGTDLEYKSLEALQYASDPERKKRVIFEISKDVSSMANAAGGHIIYGIREEEHLPRQLQQGFASSEGKHEWLENIIGSSIKPKITDLRILRVPLSTSSPGNEVLVAYVPRSLTGHQTNDGRYYQRQNFSIIKLED
jgi:predicted HTH transcriptional regulator